MGQFHEWAAGCKSAGCVAGYIPCKTLEASAVRRTRRRHTAPCGRTGARSHVRPVRVMRRPWHI